MTSERCGRKDKNQNIQVFVRLRPLNQRERDIKSLGVVEVVNNREVVVRQSQQTSHTKKFTFDRAFGPHAKQLEIYQEVVSPLIEEVLCGYNCTVFAYGQTGTGKTHTMVGEHTGEGTNWQNDPLAGIIPRALSQLFDELRLSNTEYTVRVSYLELYNEELFDLLSSSEDNSKLRIYEDVTRKGSNIVNGLEEITVYNKSEVYKIMAQGQERKRVASTLMNAQSSRSHTVFTIVVHMKENSPEGEELVKIGKLNLVDLAGSENISKAGSDNPAKRERARECVNINQSLLTLGRVITALVERHPHIPYRESKLTRILQESLGGRTKTSIIATVSPGHKDLEETMSTLEYANRAKNIQNKPEVNQKMTKKAILKEYAEEIDRLKRDLQAARDKNGVYLASETFAEITLKQEEQRKEIQELLLAKRAMEEKREQADALFTELSEQLQHRQRQLEITAQQLDMTKGRLHHTSTALQATRQQCDEQRHLVSRHARTEVALGAAARSLLDAADTAADHATSLHRAVDRRRTVEATNLQVTQKYRQESAEQRQCTLQAMDACAAELTNVLNGLCTEIESHTTDSIQCHQENTETIQQLMQKLDEAMAEITNLTAASHGALSEQIVAQRGSLHALLAQRTSRVHQLVRDWTLAVAGLVQRARGEGAAGARLMEHYLNTWLSSSSEHVSSLRSSHAELLSRWRSGLSSRLQLARSLAAGRSAARHTRDTALRACREAIAEETSLQRSRIATQQSDIEREREETSERLRQWVDEERRNFEERLARHVQEQTRILEDRLAKRTAEIEEEKRLLEERMSARLSWHDEQLRCSEEDSAFEAVALADQERDIDTSEKEAQEFGQRFEEGTNNIASSLESVSEGVLEALNRAHATLLQALEEASSNIESGVTKLIDSDRNNNQQLTEETDLVFNNVVQESKRAMDTVVEDIGRARQLSSAQLRAALGTTERAGAASRAQQHAARALAAAVAAAPPRQRDTLAACLRDMEDTEETYLARQYTLYTPSGETPVRQQYQYPRSLAATSPHERILARYRAARRTQTHDDDCVLVESLDRDCSDSESSSDSAVVFAAPSPPAPPAPLDQLPEPRAGAGNLMKSTSETDIYTRKKQQGKENDERTITVSSLKKPSKLPAPTSHKKPLADRHNTMS